MADIYDRPIDVKAPDPDIILDRVAKEMKMSRTDVLKMIYGSAIETNIHCMFCGHVLIKAQKGLSYYDCPKCTFKISNAAVNAIIDSKEGSDII